MDKTNFLALYNNLLKLTSKFIAGRLFCAKGILYSPFLL